ncbi:nucleolin [Thraustotheca clavata]|uniref:Nucleolin n=1 Tax=Thraustotheca clavata TaxID=74557 RepID=A0A1V9ZZT0_9STRA|nr:nucleolin [Thraustotheca clavata]
MLRSFVRAFSSGNPHVWIGGLPFSTSETQLRSLFEPFGTIKSVDLTTNLDGRPKGTALITFSTAKEANAALAMDRKYCGNRWMHVRLTEVKKSLPMEKPEGCKKVFFANIPFQMTEHDVQQLFLHCGAIEKVFIMRDRSSGRSKGFGFIDFEQTESTDEAVKMAGTYVKSRLMNVNYAPFETPERKIKHEKKISTIFVANIPTDVDEETLKAMFEHCGEIRTIQTPHDQGKNFAHITFESVDQAQEAIKLSGCEFDGHRMHVSMAINKPKPNKEESKD